MYNRNVIIFLKFYYGVVWVLFEDEQRFLKIVIYYNETYFKNARDRLRGGYSINSFTLKSSFAWKKNSTMCLIYRESLEAKVKEVTLTGEPVKSPSKAEESGSGDERIKVSHVS